MADKVTQNEEQVVDSGFMDAMEGAGFQNLRQDDYAIGFLKLLQPQSPELLEGGENYIPGAKAGMFINTLSQKLYGSEIDLIPVWYDDIWLEWAPNRGGLKGRHAPGSIPVNGDPFGKMTCVATDGSGGINEIVESQMFYVVAAKYLSDGPLVMSLSKTGIRHGKRWNSMIGMTRLPSGKQAPFFSSVWTLKSVLNKNDKGSWYALGAKSTNIVWKRFISKLEFESFVSPAYKRIEAGQKADYAQIEGPKQESEY